jgi:DNA/RNA endonuclease YhcR with UshA esterase domain
MQEKSLMILSVIISVAGLVSMLLISQNMDIDKVPIGMLTPDDVGRGVKICGSVEDEYTSEDGHTFFSLKDDTGGIRVVMFNSKQSIGGDVCVTGSVDFYEGDIEIIANEVVNA